MSNLIAAATSCEAVRILSQRLRDTDDIVGNDDRCRYDDNSTAAATAPLSSSGLVNLFELYCDHRVSWYAMTSSWRETDQDLKGFPATDGRMNSQISEILQMLQIVMKINLLRKGLVLFMELSIHNRQSRG